MTIFNGVIEASANDAFESAAGAVTLNGSAVGILDIANEWGIFRFLNVTIPQGSTINSAIFSGMPNDAANDEPNCPMFCEDVDNSAEPTTSANNISSRARTTATVTWNSADLGANGSTYFDAPDMVACVQEVIDRPGWVSGNALSVIIQSAGDAARDLALQAWDTNPAQAAKLTIDYTAAGAITLTPSSVTIPIITVAPTVSKTLTISPSPVAIPIVIPAPSLMVDQIILPSPMAILISIPAPTVSVAGVSIIRTWKSAWEIAWI